ncbi:PLP-dependent aminotransferase family protein [Vitiosangium sp. GDMCC 1.1324]|uniref:MocR-like pyridoxine biosynthesis transcription factor PdxR n=1 Tax=Vitiosangium sp. (strain GDMCC 1.1324) TaxID=2138576 RepID=UPI000D33C495|nr:PLP-dependent aminotransferase family protein [Vitiosangium sp. GDMCC 1.1324]PTL82409.1 GntR family transcriptional regulator [Vitiosangium sp. GDMCC 1.1324]
MEFHVTLSGSRDLARQIYEQFKQAILEGRLRPGEAIPPTRELAARLGVSRNTVTSSYERLFAEGFVSGRVGAGTFVRQEARSTAPARRAKTETGLRALPIWDSIQLPPERAPRAPAYDFRVGTPDLGLFPYAEWRRLIARQLRSPAGPTAAYGDPAGHSRLRAAIARHIRVSRSIRADAEDVIVTGGTQQALDLIGRILIEPGTCVAVEDPGYPLARLAFESQGARITPVSVDAEGLNVDAIPDAARLVYVTPSHQFPLGMPMTLARRMALLAWAERHQAAVVEDDYDSEFRFGGRPLEPLQSLDRAGHVLYVGSFSKVLLPGLRLGYLVAPASLRPALRTARFLTDWHSPPFLQAALAQFIEEGLLARHIRKARREYQVRHEQLEQALRRHLAAWLEPIPSVAGLHIGALFRDDRIDATEVVRAAQRVGVAVAALSRFSSSPTSRQGLVLGYGAIPVSLIDEGVRRLAASIRAIHPR